jgi:large subunit ribosomal protein L9
VTKNEISLPEGALRHLGEFTLDVQLHSDITETITVVIEAE